MAGKKNRLLPGAAADLTMSPWSPSEIQENKAYIHDGSYVYYAQAQNHTPMGRALNDTYEAKPSVTLLLAPNQGARGSANDASMMLLRSGLVLAGPARPVLAALYYPFDQLCSPKHELIGSLTGWEMGH